MPEPTYRPSEDYNSQDARIIFGHLENIKTTEHLETCRNMIETLRRNHSNNNEALWDYEGLMVVWKLKRYELKEFSEMDDLIANALSRRN